MSGFKSLWTYPSLWISSAATSTCLNEKIIKSRCYSEYLFVVLVNRLNICVKFQGYGRITINLKSLAFWMSQLHRKNLTLQPCGLGGVLSRMRFTLPDGFFVTPSFQKFGWSLAQHFQHYLCSCLATRDCDLSRLQRHQKWRRGRYDSRCPHRRVLPRFHTEYLSIPPERILDTGAR